MISTSWQVYHSFTGRWLRSGNLPVCFYSEAEIYHFAPQRRLVAPIQVKFAIAEGLLGPLHARWCTGMGTRPQNRKHPILAKNSPHRRESFDRFLQMLRLSCALLLCVSVSHMTWFASYVTELFQRNCALVMYPEFFGAPCRKPMRWIKKWLTPFRRVSTFSLPQCEVWGDRSTRAGSRCVNMVFVFYLSRSDLGALFVRGVIVWTCSVTVYGSIFSFRIHLRRDCLSDALEDAYFIVR